MSIVELGALGEFIASIAVVITLVFLTVQLRFSRKATDENTAVIRAAAAAQSQDYLATINELLMTDAGLSKLFTDAFDQGSFDGFEQDEIFRVQMGLRANMQHFESMYFQYEQGLLGKRIWELRRNYICSFIKTPPASEWWSAKRESSTFTEEFIANVETADGFVMGELGQRAI